MVRHYGCVFVWLWLTNLAFADSNSPLPVPDVVVTAPQQSTGELATLANTTTITQTTIENSGADDIVELLAGQPGVHVYTNSGDPQRASISLRGFGSNATQNTLILVDGRRLTNPDIAAADLSTIPLSHIERIEILPGSAGVLYGDQAVGGVINIITKQSDHLSQTAQLQFGSYHTTDAYVSTAWGTKNGFNVQIDGDKQISDNYREHNEINSGGAALRLGYRYDRGSLFLKGQYRQRDLNLPGSLTGDQAVTNRRGVGTGSEHSFTNDNSTIVTAGMEHWLTSHWKLQTDVSQRWTDVNSVYDKLQSPSSRYSTQLNPLLIGHYNLFKRPAIWRIGVNLEYDDYRLQAPPPDTYHYSVDDKQFMQSVYTQWQIPISQRWQVIAGVRGAWLQGDLNQGHFHNALWVSELGLHYQFTSSLMGYVRRSGNYRFPKADEQNNYGVTVSTPITPLKPQTGVSYETGLRFKKPRYQMEIAFYQLNLHNEIAFMPPNDNSSGTGTNHNLDPTRRYGVLLDNHLHLTEFLTLEGSYTYTDARYHYGAFSGKRISLVPRHTGRAAINYQLSPHWHLLTEGIYTGKLFASGDNNNQHSIAGYTVYNAAIHYQYQNVFLTGRINNITAQKYNEFVFYYDPTLSYYPAPERNFVITLGYRF